MLLVKDSVKVVSINHRVIRKVESLYFYPLGFKEIAEERKPFLKRKLQALKTLLEGHAFFSFDLDSTHRIGTPLGSPTREEYQINKELLQDVEAFDCSEYSIPMVIVRFPFFQHSNL